MPGGGGGADLDAVTAEAGNVEAGKVIVGPDGEPISGTLKNLSQNPDAQFQTGNGTPVIKGDAAFMQVNTDNVNRALIRYDGASERGKAIIQPNTLIGIPAAEMAAAGGLTAAKLAQGQSAFGITGTYKGLGNATAADVRKGKTFSTAALSNATGTMAEKGAQTYTPKSTAQSIAANQYLTGAQTIAGDGNLVPGNIKKNVTIFGVRGTFEGYVPVATDLYLRGNNPAGFAANGSQSLTPYTFQSGAIYVWGSYGYAINRLLSALSYNLSPYTYVNFEFNNITGDHTTFKVSGDSESDTWASAETTGTGSKTLSLNVSNVNKTTKVGVYIKSDETRTNTNALQVYRIWLS